jgi:ATP-binding cassette subfamily B (MDR/TAP) protein 9
MVYSRGTKRLLAALKKSLILVVFVLSVSFVTTIVFYGGLLVRNGDMTSGQLVSFLLYLQSLSDAFAQIGWVFSSLTQAVGAADKVFELMNRKPRIKPPSPQEVQEPPPYEGILGIEALKTRRQRTIGLHPESARGEIVLENVNLSYPARPQRQILNGLSLKIEPGTLPPYLYRVQYESVHF